MSTTQASKMLGVSTRTLRNYTRLGKLPDVRNPANGRRVFLAETIRQMTSSAAPVKGKTVVYGRVSSRRQQAEGSLDRQLEHLQRHCKTQGLEVHSVHKDVASGLSDTRPGLLRALRACTQPEVTSLTVAHKDRLARFGVNVIAQMLAAQNVTINVVDTDLALSSSQESELVQDMIAVVTSFSGKLYGQRSATSRRLRNAVKTGVPDV